MRELTMEEQELIAGGTYTDEVVVTASPDGGDDGWGDWGDWGDYGDWGDGGSGDQGDSPPPEPTPEPYPTCVEAAPAGADSGKVMDAARSAASAIAAGNDEGREFSSFIYSLNGVVGFTTPHSGNADTVDWTTNDLPAGAHILGLVHNHPDQSGISDGYPSPDDWNAYNQLQNRSLPNGITMDANALHFIYTNEDHKTRVYDNTDKNQTTPSCAI